MTAIKNELQKVQESNERLRSTIAATSSTAERYMRHGITVGAAYAVHYGAGSGARLHGVQQGSATVFVAVFPWYWGSSAGANAYCAAQWSASEDDARTAEARASEEQAKTSNHLRVVRQRLSAEETALTQLRDQAATDLINAAPSCKPASAEPPGRGVSWTAWCNGKLLTSRDREAAVLEIETQKALAAAASPPGSAEGPIRNTLQKLGCARLSEATTAIVKLPAKSTTTSDIETACELAIPPAAAESPATAGSPASAGSPTAAAGSPTVARMDGLAAQYSLAAMLLSLNLEATKNLEALLQTDFTDRRRRLSYLAYDLEVEADQQEDLLASSGYATELRAVVAARDVGAWPTPADAKAQTTPVQPHFDTPSKLLQAQRYIRATYRIQLLRDASDDLEEDRQALPRTQPAACLPYKLGAFIGAGAPFEATVYMPDVPGGGIVQRDVSPVLSWGGVLAPNALFSLLVGASVGTVARDAEGEDPRTEPIFMGTMGLGGNLDLVSVFK